MTSKKTDHQMTRILSLMEALDHLYVSRKYKDVVSCSECKKLCSRKCPSCDFILCGNGCDKCDWSTHTRNCTKLFTESSEAKYSAAGRYSRKSLESDFSNISLTRENLMSDVKSSPFGSLTKMLSGQESRQLSFTTRSTPGHFRSPKTNENQNQKKDMPRYGRNQSKGPRQDRRGSNVNITDRKSQNNQRKSLDNEPKNLFRSTSSEKSFSNERINKNEKKCEARDSNVLRHLSGDSSGEDTKKIFCMYRESAIKYWVMNVNDLPNYEYIQTRLNEDHSSYETVTPKPGQLCACQYENEWYRGEIKALSPKAVVHFIDFGNYYEYESTIFKKIPDFLEKFPGLVYPVVFEGEICHQYVTDDLESKQLIVKETNDMFDGGLVMKILSENFMEKNKNIGELERGVAESKSEPSSVHSSTHIDSVINEITEKSRGTIFFLPGFGNLRFGAIITEKYGEPNLFLQKILSLNTSEAVPINAKEGDYVLVADKNGVDQCGLVLNTNKAGNSYHVQLASSNVVIMTKAVYSVPEGVHSVLDLGVVVNLDEIFYDDSLFTLKMACFEVVGSQANGKWKCSLKSICGKNVIANATLCKPSEKLRGEVHCKFLKSGCSVEISALGDWNAFYVRKSNRRTKEKFIEMIRILNEFAASAPSLTSPLNIGNLCCAPSDVDKKFHRCQVISVTKVKFSVFFVDIGSVQEFFLADLKPLPPDLQTIPFFCFKVSAGYFLTKPYTTKIIEFLKALISKNFEFILTYKRYLEGVVLTEKESGMIVTDVIERMMNEDEFEPDFFKGAMMTDDILKYAALPLENTCEVVLLYVQEKEFDQYCSFWVADSTNENFIYVNSKLTLDIAEYCNNVNVTPYRPRLREVCLAEYDGTWYRAVTIEEMGDDYLIFFCDFGNVCRLSFNSIRKIKKEFTDPPVLAINCTIEGSDRFKNKPELKKKVFTELEKKVNTCIADVKVCRVRNDAYTLRIPAIEALLG